MKRNKSKTTEGPDHVDGGTLSAEERRVVSEFIQNKKASRSDQQRLQDEMQLFEMKLRNYLAANEEYLPVGDFLEQYINLLGAKKSEFASQIEVHKTKLSNLINNRVKLNARLAYKLEAHSKLYAQNIIEAVLWIALQQKAERQMIMRESTLKSDAYKAVKSGLKKS